MSSDVLIINFIVFILFGAVLFFRMQVIWKKNAVYEDTVSKSDSFMLRGIAALFIIFSHYVTYVGESSDTGLGPARIYIWFGGLGVCIFFFVSGYGIEKSYKDSPVTIAFLKKRLLNIAPSYILIRFLFGLIEKKYNNGIGYFTGYLLGVYEPLWFVTEILLIYLLYYLSKKISPSRFYIAATALCLALMSAIMLWMGLEPRWYNANLIFVLGMLAAKYNHSFVNFFRKNYCIKMAVMSMIFLSLSVLYSMEKGSVLADFLKLISGSFFCLLFFGLVLKVRVQSGIIKWFGEKSLYLYMIHLEIWKIYDMLIGDRHMQFVICLTGTFVCTFLYCKMENAFQRLLKRKKDERNDA